MSIKAKEWVKSCRQMYGRRPRWKAGYFIKAEVAYSEDWNNETSSYDIYNYIEIKDDHGKIKITLPLDEGRSLAKWILEITE